MSGAARVAAEAGPVVVACGDREIADVVEAAGGRAVLTDPQLPTGSDRIHQAITRIDPGRAHDAVINVQGDLPMLDPSAIRIALAGLADPEIDIATLAAMIETTPHSPTPASTRSSPVSSTRPGRRERFISARRWCRGATGRITSISGFTLIAARRSNALSALPRGVLEQRERLEQLRALEAGMRISVSLIEAVRLGVQVDTPADLERARRLMQQMKTG